MTRFNELMGNIAMTLMLLGAFLFVICPGLFSWAMMEIDNVILIAMMGLIYLFASLPFLFLEAMTRR